MCSDIYRVATQLYRYATISFSINDTFNLLKPSGNFTYHQV
jgi:hypothetical protein